MVGDMFHRTVNDCTGCCTGIEIGSLLGPIGAGIGGLALGIYCSATSIDHYNNPSGFLNVVGGFLTSSIASNATNPYDYVGLDHDSLLYYLSYNYASFDNVGGNFVDTLGYNYINSHFSTYWTGPSYTTAQFNAAFIQFDDTTISGIFYTGFNTYGQNNNYDFSDSTSLAVVLNNLNSYGYLGSTFDFSVMYEYLQTIPNIANLTDFNTYAIAYENDIVAATATVPPTIAPADAQLLLSALSVARYSYGLYSQVK
jgi:hypothetical protein